MCVYICTLIHSYINMYPYLSNVVLSLDRSVRTYQLLLRYWGSIPRRALHASSVLQVASHRGHPIGCPRSPYFANSMRYRTLSTMHMDYSLLNGVSYVTKLSGWGGSMPLFPGSSNPFIAADIFTIKAFVS